MRANALEPAQHGRHVGPKDSAIGVNLINDHVAQLGEERRPLRMIGQHRRVEHVGVREHKIGLTANAAALGGRRVSVVDAGANRSCEILVTTYEVQQALELILCERLGRK